MILEDGTFPKTLVIRFSGDSGDGVQVVGEQFTLSAALKGCDVRTLPDFPAEIRAPSGTLGGISGFQLAISEEVIFTPGENLDVLVAFNPAALKKSLNDLKPGGLLLLNADHFEAKDWQKAGLEPNEFSERLDAYQTLSLPLTAATLKAVEALALSPSQAKKAKNFYILGLVFWLFDLNLEPSLAFIQKKFKDSAIAEANQRALKAGYNFALTLELNRQQFICQPLQREKGTYRQITGVEAVSLALATLAVGTHTELLVSGYPITPASAILQECAKLADYGIHFIQAEDEIAAIGACLGAAFGGHLALTCTSGPGFDLKSESLGLGVMTELPLVVLDIQRAGPSTGLPTKTSQSDLQQALYGRHGEAPLPVLAPQSPSDCFYLLLEAFCIAVKYMTPVIVLLDAYLANAAEPWKLPVLSDLKLPQLCFNRFPAPYQRDEHLSRSWNRPGTPGYIHQIGGLEKEGEQGRVSYEADNHQKMVSLREEKVKQVAKDYLPLALEGSKQAEVLLIGWGSTYGSLKLAVEHCEKEGLSIALLQLRYLFPLPLDLEAYLQRFKTVLVAELNTGQLCRLLRAEYLIPARSIRQYNGQPFSQHFLVQAIKKELAL